MSYENQLIREATGQSPDFMEPEPEEPNVTTRQAKVPLRISYKTQQQRLAFAKILLAEALERMMAGNPPPYARTWTTCLRIKRFLK